MKPPQLPYRPRRVLARIVAVSWRDLAVSLGPAVLLVAGAIWFVMAWLQPAPPNHLTITSGPPGTRNWLAAEQYKKILAENGVTLTVLPSQGSPDNLARLTDPRQSVDVGFVQGGLTDPGTDAHLISLGSIGYLPLVVLYRGAPIERLSQLSGKRLALGVPGSGTRELGLKLLALNGIAPNGKTAGAPTSGGPTEILDAAHDDAAQALIDGRVDAAFLSGDSTQVPVLTKLVRIPGIRIFSFAQAPAYTRRVPYLTDITLPMGVIDLATNLPASDVHTLAPTVELIARDTLHPALSDLLLQAAQEVQGRPTVLQKAGEFPSPVVHGDIPLSDDAARFYKSGKRFLYKLLPFWMASLVNRMLFIAVPLIVVLIPGLRLVPLLYGWRVRARIYRWYGVLIALERDALGEHTREEGQKLLQQLDEIEAAVNRLRMPLAFAGQFYVLREHIDFVRDRLLTHYPDIAAT